MMSEASQISCKGDAAVGDAAGDAASVAGGEAVGGDAAGDAAGVAAGDAAGEGGDVSEMWADACGVAWYSAASTSPHMPCSILKMSDVVGVGDGVGPLPSPGMIGDVGVSCFSDASSECTEDVGEYGSSVAVCDGGVHERMTS